MENSKFSAECVWVQIPAGALADKANIQNSDKFEQTANLYMVRCVYDSECGRVRCRPNKSKEDVCLSELIKIGNQEMSIKEWNGKRVVTFSDIDKVHERPSGTAGRNFRKNRKHFIENIDFFSVEITGDEFRRQFELDKHAGRTITFVTESGYLMLAKSFTDDLAWEVQRQLVDTYFTVRQRVTEMDILHQMMRVADEQKQQISTLSQQTQINTEDIAELRRKIDIIGAYENSGLYSNLRSSCAARVMTLLSNEIYRTLWSPYFYKAIHSGLARHFNVASTKLIRTEDLREAEAWINNWTPTNAYITEKTSEMINKAAAGTLKDTRVMALAVWRQNTDDGRNNPFT